MPPHIHYLSPTLTLPIPLLRHRHHHHRNLHHLLRREPPQQAPCNDYLLCCRITRWDDSNAESFTTHNFSHNDEENIEEEDYTLKWDLDVFQEYIDSIWILKVFRGYGFALPFIVAPLVYLNGLKSFLLAMGVSIWASSFSFAVLKVSDSQEERRSNTKKNKTRSSSRNEFKNAKKAENGYKTWVKLDNDSSFGGWDEVNYGNGYSKTGRRSEKKKKSGKRKSTTSSPLLLRLLITVFPFLSSWNKML